VWIARAVQSFDVGVRGDVRDAPASSAFQNVYEKKLKRQKNQNQLVKTLLKALKKLYFSTSQGCQNTIKRP